MQATQPTWSGAGLSLGDCNTQRGCVHRPRPLTLAVALVLTTPAFFAQAQDVGGYGAEFGREVPPDNSTRETSSPASSGSMSSGGSSVGASSANDPVAGSGLRPGAPTLPTVMLTEEAGRDGTTEGTGSYTTNSTDTATKLKLSPRETPNTVTVITRQKMDDLGLDTVHDALKSTNGIFLNNRGHSSMEPYSRGFKIQTRYDGMASPIGLRQGEAPDPDSAFIDRVEFQQGATGLLSGAGDPGGVVNVVRKRPTRDFQAHVQADLGSWQKRRLMGDVSGTLSASGAVRGRFVAFGERRNSWRDYVHEHNHGFYGALDADLGPSTTVGLSWQHQKNDARDDSGLPTAADGTFLNLPRSAFMGGIDARDIKKLDSFSLSLEQKLTTDWAMKAQINRSKTDNPQVYDYLLNHPESEIFDAVTGEGLTLEQNRNPLRYRSTSLDVAVQGAVDAFGYRHELAAGVSGYKLKLNGEATEYVSTPINVYSFNPALFPAPTSDFSDLSDEKTRLHGIYAVGRFQLSDDVKAILGSRVSWYKYDETIQTVSGDDPTETTAERRENGVVSPYGGIVYELNEQLSTYVSYSDIFSPQANRNVQGGILPPIVGRNLELGVKGEFLEGKLNASFSLFRLTQSNMAERDPDTSEEAQSRCEGLCYRASDEVDSKGIDLRVEGEPSTNLNISFGYTYVHSEYAAGEKKGRNYLTYSGSPQHSLSASAFYRILRTRWTIGGNILARSEIVSSSDNKYFDEVVPFRIRQGSIVTADLSAKYQIDRKSSLSVMVRNLFDRKYYDSVDYPTFMNYYGAPRSVGVSYRYDFR